MPISLKFAALFLSAISGISTAALASNLLSSELQCEQRVDPLQVDAARPRLSWILSSSQRGERQTAYEILVASSPQKLAAHRGDLWDSGKVKSSDCIGVEYAGKPLVSREDCFWQVRVWDASNGASDWSAPAKWEMGLLSPSDWSAKWIDLADPAATQPTTHATGMPALPIFRREFTSSKPLKRATIFIVGLGQFELHINGEKISDDLLQPGWTDYAKTDLCVAYDITGNIKPGVNAIGVMLGNGMYNVVAGGRYAKFRHSYGPPKLITQIYLDYADGTSDCIVSDSKWKATAGPITFSNIYGGEDFDARRDPNGWDSPGFNDSKWSAAEETTSPGGTIPGTSRSAPPIRVMDILKPVKTTEIRPGVTVYDLGQNCSMMPLITVSGPAGSRVRITPGELLDRNRGVTQGSMGGSAYYVYTLKGTGEETWSPRFTYHGSRYLQVAVYPADDSQQSELPKVLSIAGQFISSSSPATGEFSCSNDLFNRTNTLIRWAIRSNMVSLLTDCPHRERLGWLEQDYLNGPSLMYNFDLPVLFNKISDDMGDAQNPDGLVPDIAPQYTVMQGGFLDSPEWGSACIQVPWQAYRWYGDSEILENHYDMMKRYVDYLGTKANDHILNYGLGDWYDLGPKKPGVAQLTPVALTATAMYYDDLLIMSQVAKIVGKSDESSAFTTLAGQVHDAFNLEFYHPGTHQYATGSQTANAMPLVFGLAPETDRAAIVDNIVQDVRAHDNGLTAGDVGFHYLLRALANGGRSDVIFDMNNQSDKPGYGYQLAHGATSLIESWDARPNTSQDHFMLGHIMEWFYGDLAGIQPDPDSVAFASIRIKPAIVGDLTWARATYDSVRGPISSSWKISIHGFSLDVKIPPGCTATVYVPATSDAKVTESGKPADSADGVKFLRMEDSAAVFQIESGAYSFASE